jgi:hypothetical protein
LSLSSVLTRISAGFCLPAAAFSGQVWIFSLWVPRISKRHVKGYAGAQCQLFFWDPHYIFFSPLARLCFLQTVNPSIFICFSEMCSLTLHRPGIQQMFWRRISHELEASQFCHASPGSLLNALLIFLSPSSISPPEPSPSLQPVPRIGKCSQERELPVLFLSEFHLSEILVFLSPHHFYQISDDFKSYLSVSPSGGNTGLLESIYLTQKQSAESVEVQRCNSLCVSSDITVFMGSIQPLITSLLMSVTHNCSDMLIYLAGVTSHCNSPGLLTLPRLTLSNDSRPPTPSLLLSSRAH